MVYIGGKLLASGFALSGVQVYSPPAQPDAIWNDFQQAQEGADLIMISQIYAQLLGARLVRYQQRKPVPPVLCLPEVDSQTTPVRKTIYDARASLGLSQ